MRLRQTRKYKNEKKSCKDPSVIRRTEKISTTNQNTYIIKRHRGVDVVLALVHDTIRRQDSSGRGSGVQSKRQVSCCGVEVASVQTSNCPALQGRLAGRVEAQGRGELSPRHLKHPGHLPQKRKLK